MRWGIAVLVLSTALGCSVVDEIDKIGSDSNAPPPAPAQDDSLPAVPEGSNQAKLRAYYNRSAKPTKEDPGNPIVLCQLSGIKQYMRLDDCELRGGRTNL